MREREGEKEREGEGEGEGEGERERRRGMACEELCVCVPPLENRACLHIYIYIIAVGLLL